MFCYFPYKILFLGKVQFRYTLASMTTVYHQAGSISYSSFLFYDLVILLSDLTLCILGNNFSRRQFEHFFLFFLENRFDISCKLSPMETICMKSQILFSGKIKKIMINSLSAELARRGVKVKQCLPMFA